MLFPDGQWRFTHNGGATTADGKVYYPAALSLVLDTREALRLIELLARGIAEPNTGVDKILVTFCGAMDRMGDVPAVKQE